MKLIEQLKKAEIIKHLGVLVSGTAIAQLIIIAFQVVLRRVFSPEDFGAFAVYMSVVGIAITIISLRFEQTILLPKQHSDGIKLTKLSIIIAFVLSAVFAMLLFLLSEWFMNFIGLDEAYKHWLIYLPLSVLLFGIYQALNYLLLRFKLYSTSGSNKVIRRVTEGVTQSGFGSLGNSLGLVMGDVIGHIVIISRSIFKLREKTYLLDTTGTTSTYRELIKKFQDFPVKNTIPALLNTLSRLLPIIIISKLFSQEITGYFDLARVVLILPLSLITVSLNQVFVQQFSQKRNNKQSIKKESLAMFYGLLSISICFVLAIKLFGIPLFEIVFGEQWTSSAHYAQILVWAFAFKFVISPFNASFVAFEKIGIGSIWQTIYFLLIISLLYFKFDSFESFLIYYVVIELIAYFIVGIINFTILYRYERSL